ncbi:MAG: class I SAM-dependent methyltransferase [Dokdonella sp.]
MTEAHTSLPFTGERFTPECVREIWYEHWHRYAFARSLAVNKRVLDAACGEGYGSALLADVAAEVTGVDIDPASVAHARARYATKLTLRYECADATALSFPDREFDLIVSFETLEHLAGHEQLIAGFSRVLADDGLLVISSPDKRTYSDLAGFRNEFHVRELYREELLALLQPHFKEVRLYGQKLMFQSTVWALDGGNERSEIFTASAGGESLAAGFDAAPMYFIAVCAKRALPAQLPGLSLFGDREESVYAHYNHEIRQNMGAGARIAELEAEVERLRGSTQTPRVKHDPAPRRDWRWWRRNR